MFIALAGGFWLSKNMYVPQKKNVSMTMKGSTDHAISSRSEPWIGFGTSCGERCRYFMANVNTPTKIRTVITMLTAHRYHHSASYPRAAVEAWAGSHSNPEAAACIRRASRASHGECSGR